MLFDRADSGWLDLAAFGVDHRGAETYARWRSARTVLPYRLPPEDEWEKAACGIDGRIFPWGNAFDASFYGMRESAPGAPHP